MPAYAYIHAISKSSSDGSPSRPKRTLLMPVECLTRRRFYSLYLRTMVGSRLGCLRHGFWQKCALDRINLFFVIAPLFCSKCAIAYVGPVPMSDFVVRL